MLSSVNILSDVPVYIQIENEVQCAIASGKLKSGDQLPSMQALAKRISANINTVGKAYRDLEVMGLVYTRRGMGSFVCKGVQAQCHARCRSRAVERLFEITQEAKAAGVSKTDLSTILSKSFALDTSPYAEVPAKVLALAKVKK